MNNYAPLGTRHSKSQIYSRASVILKDILTRSFHNSLPFFVEICFGDTPVMSFRINEFHRIPYRSRYLVLESVNAVKPIIYDFLEKMQSKFTTKEHEIHENLWSVN